MSFDCYLSLQDPQWFHSSDKFGNAQLIRVLFPGALRYCRWHVWCVMCTNGQCKEIWVYACTNTPCTHKDVIMSDEQSRVDVPTPALFPQLLLSLRLWLPRSGNALYQEPSIELNKFLCFCVIGSDWWQMTSFKFSVSEKSINVLWAATGERLLVHENAYIVWWQST